MKIIFTDFATIQLKGIYDYYTSEVSESLALKVVNKIIDRIEELDSFPHIGAKEKYTSGLKLNHRFLVCGNYKVIYRVIDQFIYITDIFDSRQDPSRIIKRNRLK